MYFAVGYALQWRTLGMAGVTVRFGSVHGAVRRLGARRRGWAPGQAHVVASPSWGTALRLDFLREILINLHTLLDSLLVVSGESTRNMCRVRGGKITILFLWLQLSRLMWHAGGTSPKKILSISFEITCTHLMNRTFVLYTKLCFEQAFSLSFSPVPPW